MLHKENKIRTILAFFSFGKRPVDRFLAHRVYFFLALFLAAASLAMIYVSTWGDTPHFHQEFCGPSLMWACGRGWVNPAEGGCAALDTFLHPPMNTGAPPPIDQFDCSQLPADFPTAPMLHVHNRHLYLLLAIAFCWRIFGVAWSSLTPLYGLLFGAAILAAYGIFRLAMRRSLALFCALMLMLSPLHLHYLPRLRDYGKAPFILGAIWLMGLLVTRRFSQRRLWGISLACGALLGVGAGFRTDVLICLPAFIFTVLFFLPGRLWRKLPTKAIAILLFLASYTLCSWPITARLEQQGNKFHPAMLGFAEIYDARLGVGGAPYQWVHRHHDIEPMALVHAYAGHREGGYLQFDFETPEYELYADGLFSQALRTFPADFVIRAYAAVLRVLDEMRPSGNPPLPRGVTSAFLCKIYTLWSGCAHLFFGHTRYVALLVLALLAARDLRRAFAALFFLLFFAGYTSIYYSGRNSFHLEFLTYWAGGFLLEYVCWCILQLRSTAHRRRRLAQFKRGLFWRKVGLRWGIFFTILTLGITLPCWVLCSYQQHQFQRLCTSYERANWETLSPSLQSVDEHTVRWVAPLEAGVEQLPVPAGQFYFDCQLLCAEFDTSDAPVHFRARYAPDLYEYAPQWEMELPATGKGRHTHVYFPVYYASWHTHYVKAQVYFRGLEMLPEQAQRLVALRCVDDSKKFPLLLTIALPEGWEEETRFYKRLIR